MTPSTLYLKIAFHFIIISLLFLHSIYAQEIKSKEEFHINPLINGSKVKKLEPYSRKVKTTKSASDGLFSKSSTHSSVDAVSVVTLSEFYLNGIIRGNVEPGAEIKLSWQKATQEEQHLPAEITYELIIDDNPDFNDPTHYTTTDTFYTLRITDPGVHYWYVVARNLAGDELSSKNTAHFYSSIDTSAYSLFDMTLDNYWIYDYYYNQEYFNLPSAPKTEYNAIAKAEIKNVYFENDVFKITIEETIYKDDGSKFTNVNTITNAKDYLTINDDYFDIILYQDSLSQDTSWSISDGIVCNAYFKLQNASFNFNNETYAGQKVTASGSICIVSYDFKDTLFTAPHIGILYKNYIKSSDIITQRKYNLVNGKIGGVYYGVPHSPIGIEVEASDEGLKISWLRNFEDNIMEYRIYGGFNQQPDNLLGTTSDTSYTITIPDFSNSSNYYLAVSAATEDGVEGVKRTITLQRLTLAEFSVNDVSKDTVELGAEIKLSWQKATQEEQHFPAEITYELIIDDNPDFNDPTHYTTTDTFYTVRITDPGVHYWYVVARNLAGDELSSKNIGHFYSSIDTSAYSLFDMTLDNYWIYDYYYNQEYFNLPSAPKTEYNAIAKAEIKNVYFENDVFKITIEETIYKDDGSKFTNVNTITNAKDYLTINDDYFDIILYQDSLSQDTSWSISDEIVCNAYFKLQNASFNFNNETYAGQKVTASGSICIVSYDFKDTLFTAPHIGILYKNYIKSSDIITQRKYNLVNGKIGGVYYGVPHSPIGIEVEASDEGLKISWLRNFEDNIMEYRIYGGTSQQPDSLLGTTSDTCYTIKNLDLLKLPQYYLAVSAVTEEGIVGLKSSAYEVSNTLKAILLGQIILKQNYPNPFKSETTIEFILPKDLKTHIEVFNSAGQKVATITNKEYKAGAHSVKFYAKNLASGVYYYRLTAGEKTAVKKLVILK
ncbi:T9SS type A sorting domain-containing protein [Caldithrix abyssi]|uniref:T9SS type A sorting domain-containing protein n=1 Tax=Caldithrix abyssi TaxID=187145 RepID=UPI0009037092|nr:T9SS type A sorting domain-containing protein [Caldithrix abyssi]